MDARRISQDRLTEPSGECRNARTCQDHNERVREWAEQSARETHACTKVHERYCEDELYQVKERVEEGQRV